MKLSRMFACFTHVAMLASLALATLAFAQTAPAPLTTLSATFDPPSPEEYQPFTVTVTFSKPYCFGDAVGFSKVTLTGNALTLLQSHLGEGPCVNQRTFNVPGIPGGEFSVTVGITGSNNLNDSYNSRESVSIEQGTYSLSVISFGKVKVFSLRDPLGRYVLDYPPEHYNFSTRPPWIDYLTTRDAPEFFAFRGLGLGNIGVPKAAIALIHLIYPSPLKGVYATTSTAEADRLVQGGFTWHPLIADMYVLPIKNGVCPLGAVPVYRLFNPKGPAHRYVSSLDTYNTLVANGFIGEGMVFCAPRP